MKLVLKILGINVGLLIAGVLICEAIFGNWFFGPDYREMNIPRNTTRVFNVDKLYHGGNITYSRDKNGFRGLYDDVSSIDILTLGGSTTNQLYVDDAKTWHEVLRRKFDAVGKRISVVNAGVDGQSTRGHIAVFQRWFPLIEGLSSRYVLVYAGINDVAIKGAEKYDNMKSPDPKRRFADSIKNKSALYEMYKIVKGILAARMAKVVYGSGPRAGLDWQPWHRRDEPLEIPGDLSEHLEAYKSRIIHLNEEIHKFGAKPIFVTQPSADYRFRGNWILLPAGDKHDDAKNQFLVLNAFNHVAMRTCLDLGGICLDLAADVTFEDGDFYDRIHNSDKGAEKVGKYLFEALRSYL